MISTAHCQFEYRVTYHFTFFFRMRYSLGDLNPKRDPSPEQKRNDHLGDSGIALSANGDEDGRSAISRASTANTEVSFSPSEIAWFRPQNIIKVCYIFII